MVEDSGDKEVSNEGEATDENDGAELGMWSYTLNGIHQLMVGHECVN